MSPGTRRETAVRAVRLGGRFLESAVADRSCSRRRRRSKADLLRIESLGTSRVRVGLLGDTARWRRLREEIAASRRRRAGSQDGENARQGAVAGKHHRSPSGAADTREVNCAAIPEDLIGGVLVSARIVTGASEDRRGNSRRADGRDALLDESQTFREDQRSCSARSRRAGSPASAGGPIEWTHEPRGDEQNLARRSARAFAGPLLRSPSPDHVPRRERTTTFRARENSSRGLARFGRKPKSPAAAAVTRSSYRLAGNVRESITDRALMILSPARKSGAKTPGRDPRRDRGGEHRSRRALRDARDEFERRYILPSQEEPRARVRTAERLGLERSNRTRKLKATESKWRESSSQFSVLSSRFSVLGSRFSVLSGALRTGPPENFPETYSSRSRISSTWSLVNFSRRR